MTSTLLGNLDQSLRTVKERFVAYSLNSDGTVILNTALWTGCLNKIPRLKTYFDTCQAAIIVDIFMQCVDRWIAINNEQKHGLRNVTDEEFSAQINRICFIGQFILTSITIIEQPLAKEKVCAILVHLLPGAIITLPESLERVLQKKDIVGWKVQENAPPPLSPELLREPAPQNDILDMPPSKQDITTLGAFYKQVVQRIENPEGHWSVWLNNWWSKKHVASQKSLEKMCNTILTDKTPALKNTYALAQRYLQELLTILKASGMTNDKIKNCLDELVYASGFCVPEWATVSEKQYRELTNKTVSPLNKALQWKSEFIDQHLLTFLSTVYSTNETSHSSNLMSTLLYHYGEKLGKKELEAPSVDIHVVKKSTSLPYQWPDVFRYLQEEWEKHCVDSFLTCCQMNAWQMDIGIFLAERMKGKVEEPEKYVSEQYFEDKTLNRRGAIRFLHETLGQSSMKQLS